MQRSLTGWLIVLAVCAMDGGPAAPVYGQGAYPRVIGPTGRPYGPTQAHYQYERQYGRPWAGGPAPYDPNTGAHFSAYVGHPGQGPHYGHFNPGFYAGYGYPYGTPAVPYGYGYANVPYSASGYGYGWQNSGIPGVPGWGGVGFGYSQNWGGNQVQIGINAGGVPPQDLPPNFGQRPQFDFNAAVEAQANVARQRAADEARFAPQVPQFQANTVEPVRTRPPQYLPPPASSPAQRETSIHAQGQGDLWIREQNYLQAYSRYKQAASTAPDLAEPHYRMAWALVALKRYDLAIAELQRAVRLDPHSPATAIGFSRTLGERNQLAAMSHIQQTIAWVNEDFRSPERLFLAGALLSLEGDHARAEPLLQAAAQMGQSPAWVVAFQAAGQTQREMAQNQAAPPAQPVAPGPEQPLVRQTPQRRLAEDDAFLPPKARQQPPLKTIPQRHPTAGTHVPAMKQVPTNSLSGLQPIPKKGSAPAGGATDAASEPQTIIPAAAEESTEPETVQPIPATDADEKTPAASESPSSGPALLDPASQP